MQVMRVKKKEFTSFDVVAVVHELRETIQDSRVNNIYQLDDKTLLLKLHKTDKPAFSLILGAGKRLHLTSYVSEKPETPPAFCMALRKYLRNARLTSLEQYEFERVVLLKFKTKTGVVQLVLELFGDGNFILVSEGNRILQALTYKRMRDRNILRDEVFQFAPPSGRNPLKVGKKEFLESLKGFGEVEVVRGLARFLGIGGLYAEELLLKTGIDKTKICSALSEAEVDAVFKELQNLLSKTATGGFEPCIVLDEVGGFVDVAPFRLMRYERAGSKFQPYSSFNEALDEFYVRIASVERALAEVNVDQLKREAERLKRIISDQNKVLAEAEDKADKDRQIGDVIYTHADELQILLDRFLDAKQSGKEWDETVSKVMAEKKNNISPSTLFEFLDKALIVTVCVDGLRFSLNLRKSLFENAAEFYERSKRARQKSVGAKTALEETQKNLTEVEAKISDAQALEQAQPAEAVEKLAMRKVKRKEWFEKFRWFVSSEDFLVVAGKDAVTNEVLIKKYAEGEDIVFHADIAGAPFVVVKTAGKQPSEQVLQEAGEFAAAFSRGWRERFGSVDVYWVKPEQLSKSGPSGEYVAHGAFVVSRKRNWMRNVPLRIAIGVIVRENGEIEFIGGPLDVVKTKTEAYVVIGPGDLAGKELFRFILKALAGKMPKNIQESVLKTSVEKIREFVPYGTGQVLKN
jgi:predicted ribosome quality control (RQC) complex YloA/Tae2 family protein